jgi:hypothetical protein
MGYNYSGYRRAQADLRARPMKPALFDLNTAVWMASFDHLSAVSQSCPFTQVQILFYYSIFKGAIGQHRDNSDSKALRLFLLGQGPGSAGSTHAGQENSQVLKGMTMWPYLLCYL